MAVDIMNMYILALLVLSYVAYNSYCQALCREFKSAEQ